MVKYDPRLDKVFDENIDQNLTEYLTNGVENPHGFHSIMDQQVAHASDLGALLSENFITGKNGNVNSDKTNESTPTDSSDSKTQTNESNTTNDSNPPIN